MKKALILILAAGLILAYGCGGSSDSERSGEGGMSAQKTEGKSQGEKREGDRPGGKPGEKSEGDIDIDKLDIPQQMKDAIKSGRIPQEKVKEYLAMAKQGGSRGGEAAPVSVETVVRQNLNSYLVLNGVVEPERKIEIFSRLSAYVKSILKEEGDYVNKNTILALLDDTEIKIGYEQAKIQLEQGKLTLEEAERNFTRNQELIKRELISQQEFQTQQAEYEQRKLDYQNRQESYKDLELQLNYTKIRSLSEGYITERLIEVGDRVNANQQVYSIEDFNPLLIRVYVPTSDSIKLNPGMKAEVSTEILPGRLFDGDVKLINPRIDVQTGTVKVTVEAHDETLQLKPGMFVEVKIVIGQKEDVLVIPRKAIMYKQNLTYVFVVDNGTVSQREIKLGLIEEDHVEVLEGLQVNEKIVLVGVEGLKDGQRVDVVR